MPSTRFWKYCPICLKNRVYRPEVKTCGGRDCVATWRTFSMSEKGMAVEKAQELTDMENHAMLTGGLTELHRGGLGEGFTIIEQPPTPSPTPAPPKGMSDEEFLSKHVPGYLDKDKKD